MTRTRLALMFAGAALTGAAIGAAAGLMLAPASGAEVRRRMSWRLRDERRALEGLWERTRAAVARPCESAAAGPTVPKQESV